MNVPSQSTTTGVARSLAIIADRWKTIVALTFIVMAVAFIYTNKIASPVYESTALVTFQIPDRNENPTNGALPSSGVTREDIQTLIGNAANIDVLRAAAEDRKVDTTPDDLRRQVAVRPHGDASIIDFVGRADSPARAASLANAYAEAFVADRRAAAVKAIQAQIDQKTNDLKQFANLRPDSPEIAAKVILKGQRSELSTSKLQWGEAIRVSTQAQPPLDAVWPRTTLTLFAAMLIGIGLGSGLALLTARVDHKLHDADFDQLPAPVLVRVPFSAKAPKAGPLGPASAEPLVADAFAALGARIMLDHAGETAHVVLVSSARSGEGKSTVAANLASALAQGGRRVVLIDADMRRPMLDTLFVALQGRPGLSQVLTNSVEVEQALTLVAPNLAAIPSGPRQPNASVLLASVAFRQLIDRLSNISEIIVIDAPPALAVTDALAIAPTASRVLLVGRIGTSDVEELSQAHARLASAANTPQAIVLLGTERPTGYGYDQESRGTRTALSPVMPQLPPQASSGGASSAGSAA